MNAPVRRRHTWSTFTLLAACAALTIATVGCDRGDGDEFDYEPTVVPEARASAVTQDDGRAATPTLMDVYFPDSKFGVCGEPLATCAQAQANDSSPIRFEWLASGQDARPETMTVTESQRDGRVLTECVEFVPGIERTILEVKAVRAAGLPGPDDRTPMYLYDSLSVPIYATGDDCDSPAG